LLLMHNPLHQQLQQQEQLQPTCATATGSFKLQAIVHPITILHTKCSKHIWYRISNRPGHVYLYTNECSRMYFASVIVKHCC
jgi:hypothetical protein